MLKRTLYFGNPAYLSKHDNQLVLRLPDVEKNKDLPASFKKDAQATVPIEDIGFVILDNQQIIITHGLIAALLENNAAVITCDQKHMPTGLLLPLESHTVQNQRFRKQLEASEPLKKNLWQQTIQAKIRNQAKLLSKRNIEIANMLHWAGEVKSGDTRNHESQAAAYYWGRIFPQLPDFRRGREEHPPNNLLNYGYAILRATVARALVSSGLLPTLGIHHHNKYNAYCLADDIMEPYRPFVDEIVCRFVDLGSDFDILKTTIKRDLLQVPAIDVIIDGEKSPLMNAVHRTTASLNRCFEGESRNLIYPELK